MLSYEEALERIVKATPSPRAANVRLTAALGLVLPRPVVTRLDLPRFDNSAVDGYAVRSSDAREGTSPVALRVVGQSSAGRPYRAPVRENQAVRIFTGATVPRGADAVVMQEHVERRDHRLIVQRWPKPGQNIRRCAEVLRRGAQVLAQGTPLRPQEIGLLSALGRDTVRVYQQPTVAILVTGDELKPPGTRLKPGQIYESNGALLVALVQQAGAKAVHLGLVRDALSPLMRKIRSGLAYDLLIISGGVSVGEKDYVRRATHGCRVQEIFWRVNMKPGMPLFFGKRRRTLVFGLPGNPVSVFVTFEEFVKPALYRLMGRAWRDGYTDRAGLAADLAVSTARRTHFIRVRCSSKDGRLLARPMDGQGSHHLHSLAQADGWIRMNAEESPWSAGTPVLVKPACATLTELPAFGAAGRQETA